MKFNMNNSTPAPQPPSGKRYTFAFSRTGMIVFCVVTVIGLAWIFIFGLLVGRGYRPEAAVPELARIMPAEQNQTAMLSDQGVLPAEDLEFYDTLKRDGATGPKPPVSAPAPAPATGANVAQAPVERPAPVAENDLPPTPQQPAAAPASSPAAPEKPAPQTAEAPKPADVTAAGSAPTASPRHVPEAKKETAAKKETPTSAQRFKYVYQAAAFSEPTKADRFQQQVQALNLIARVQKVEDNGKTWHRVMVHFEGTPEDTRQLKTKLKRVGVDKALLRSKKPM